MSIWLIIELDLDSGEVVGVVSSRAKAEEETTAPDRIWEEWEIDGRKLDDSICEAHRQRSAKKVAREHRYAALSSCDAIRRPFGTAVTSGNPDLDVHIVRRGEIPCGRTMKMDDVLLPRKVDALDVGLVTCPECLHWMGEL